MIYMIPNNIFLPVKVIISIHVASPLMLLNRRRVVERYTMQRQHFIILHLHKYNRLIIFWYAVNITIWLITVCTREVSRENDFPQQWPTCCMPSSQALKMADWGYLQICSRGRCGKLLLMSESGGGSLMTPAWAAASNRKLAHAASRKGKATDWPCDRNQRAWHLSPIYFRRKWPATSYAPTQAVALSVGHLN